MSVYLELAPEVLAWMDAEVERRGLESREQLMLEALRSLGREELQESIARGMEQADAGEVDVLDASELSSMKQRSRQRAQERDTRDGKRRHI